MEKLLFLFCFIFFVGVKPVHAYIDPGTGSYLIQIAIGTLLGGLYVVKKFWKSINTFLVSLFKKLLGKQ